MPDKPRIEDVLGKELRKATGARWRRDYQPSKLRKWRIDLAVPSLKIAVEIDGRFHGSAQQQRSDSEKNNYLIAAGWRCLRYPASSVLTLKRRERIVEQIKRVMYGVHIPGLDSCVLNGE